MGCVSSSMVVPLGAHPGTREREAAAPTAESVYKPGPGEAWPEHPPDSYTPADEEHGSDGHQRRSASRQLPALRVLEFVPRPSRFRPHAVARVTSTSFNEHTYTHEMARAGTDSHLMAERSFLSAYSISTAHHMAQAALEAGGFNDMGRSSLDSSRRSAILILNALP